MTEKMVLNRLDAIKKELDTIKEHLLNVTLTNDDISALEEADRDLEDGNTKNI